MANGRIIWTENQIPKRLAELGPKIHAAVGAVMAYHAPQVQSYARSNARWTDQTGNARNGLFAEPFASRDTQGIVLYHTMPYGVWLEVRFSGRYAIIVPTITNKGPDVMRTIDKLMRKL